MKSFAILLLLVCVSCAFGDKNAESSAKIAKGDHRPFGSILGLFKEVFSRSATTSEVLTLNLTNLLVLLLLKGILIAIGVAGGLGLGGFLGRSASTSSKPYFSTDDLRWAATYMISSADKDYTCLHALACTDPENANDYLTGCKFLLKAAKVAHDFVPRFVPYDEKYEEICKNLKDAAFFNGDCDRQYPCALQNVRRR